MAPWAEKLQPFVVAWANATANVVTETRPHDDEAWAAYLTCVMYVPDEAPPPIPNVHRTLPSTTYPVRRDQNFDTAVSLEV